MKRSMLGLGILLVPLIIQLVRPVPASPSPSFGVTISPLYAKNSLGLDPDAVLAGALDDLKIRRFRLPVYWSEVEPSEGRWSFEDSDRRVAEIGKRNADVVLAVGMKLPRWPECWLPDWAKDLDQKRLEEARATYVKNVVERYRGTPAVVGWQIENETTLPFGVCPKITTSSVRKEIELVRSLDPKRPITTTVSGEISTWLGFGGAVDALGVSVYRTVTNPWVGVWHYWFLPPSFYFRKAELLRPFGIRSLYISEFQMEPWSDTDLHKTSLEDQLTVFNLDQMRDNFAYALRTGVSPVDFWGVEWWYWMKEKHSDARFWDAARTFYRAH